MKPNIALVGLFQSGKSTLANYIINQRSAEVGNGLPTTHTSILYACDDGVPIRPEVEKLPISKLCGSDSFRLACVNVIDTPGVDANDDDTKECEGILGCVDLCVIVLTKELPIGNKWLVSFLCENLKGKNYAVLLNCGIHTSENPEAPVNQLICESISRSLSSLIGKPPLCVGRVNAATLTRKFLVTDSDTSEERQGFEQFWQTLTVHAWHQHLAKLGFLGQPRPVPMWSQHANSPINRGLDVLRAADFRVLHVDTLDVVAVSGMPSFWRPVLVRFRFDYTFTKICIISSSIGSSPEIATPPQPLGAKCTYLLLRGWNMYACAVECQLPNVSTFPSLEYAAKEVLHNVDNLLEVVRHWEPVASLQHIRVA